MRFEPKNPKYNNLELAIKYLYVYGHPDDFTADGYPKVASVNKIYNGKAIQSEVVGMWKELYGYATYRQHYKGE